MSSLASLTFRTRKNSFRSDLFVHEIPSLVRHELCATLDDFEIWPDLAVLMGYSEQDVQNIRRNMQSGNSPTNELMDMWAEQDHTVTELFILLHRIQQYTAMELIRNLVDRKYHILIISGQPDISRLGKIERRDKCVSKPQRMELISTKVQNISDSNNESLSGCSYSENKSGSKSKYVTANEYASAIPKVNYHELLEATNNWNDGNVLGRGGFGTVYRGIWKCTEVAIKKIEYRGVGSVEAQKIQIQQSLNELKYLNSCRHDNILPLYGYSINGNEPCLIYQLMTGSLEQRLLPSKQITLSWKQRLHIARGTARGIQYLHTFAKRPLIHGDIKPANILLDRCMQPKIGDFGLAREGPHSVNSSMEVSRVYGTKPYLPVEFLGYRSLSTKVDTFSFGVVLLELVTGQKAYDKNREHKFLTKHISFLCSQNIRIEDLMHKYLPIDTEAEAISIAERLTTVGRVCISDKPEQRPEMVTVLQHLEY